MSYGSGRTGLGSAYPAPSLSKATGSSGYGGYSTQSQSSYGRSGGGSSSYGGASSSYGGTSSSSGVSGSTGYKQYSQLPSSTQFTYSTGWILINKLESSNIN